MKCGILRVAEGGILLFWCPGCDEAHQVRVENGHPGPCWGFNGDYTQPTFTPSVLVGTTSAGRPERNAGAPMKKRTGTKPPFKCFVCHSFVKDGRIQFLGDCTHDLAGQTVSLPDFPQ